MKAIQIPYGKETQTLHVADEQLQAVLTPRHPAAASLSQETLVRQALENPIGSPRLRELARGKREILVITSDHTRPVPSRVTMPPLLAELRCGSPDAHIVILIATGMHRPTTEAELRAKLGDAIVERE